MKVELITPEEYTDDFIVDCARVSYAKRADQFTPEQNAKLIQYLANPPDGVPHWAPFAGPRIEFTLELHPNEWSNFTLCANLAGFSWALRGITESGRLSMAVNGSLWAWLSNVCFMPLDVSLKIKDYLNVHFPEAYQAVGLEPPSVYRTKDSELRVVLRTNTLPYENLRIRAPIFVARQLDKHQVHLVKNEVSRRYVKDEPELWWPEKWHKAPRHSKQGASDELFEEDAKFGLNWLGTQCVTWYNYYIERGMAPEEARMILPQNMMTEWTWTGSLQAFARVCRERLAPNAQGATREVAAMVDEVIARKHGFDWRSKYII